MSHSQYILVMLNFNAYSFHAQHTVISVKNYYNTCSDTVSRVGIFCSLVSAIEMCKTEGVVDVFQVVKALRIQKPGAVLNAVRIK